MADAKGQTVSMRIGGTSSAGEEAEFGTSGTVITFRGFLAAYEEGRATTAARTRSEAPEPVRGRRTHRTALEPQGHETTPPPRYTEATLVRALEERGIGRPSTYAAIIGTILDRGYVFKKDSALVPTFLAFAVVGPARAALRSSRRLRLHSAHGGRPRPDRRRRRGARPVAPTLLLRQRRRGAQGPRRPTSAGSTRVRSARSTSATASSSASAATGRTSSGTAAARASPRRSSPTS